MGFEVSVRAGAPSVGVAEGRSQKKCWCASLLSARFKCAKVCDLNSPFQIGPPSDSCKSRSEPARARRGLKSRAFGVRAAKYRAGPDEARPARQSPAGPTKPGGSDEARPDRRKPDVDSGF